MTRPLSLKMKIRRLSARAWVALREVYVLARHAEPLGVPPPRDIALDGAQALAASWRRRAEEAEARVETLEVRLADAETAALDLRARLICLQGKLAATHATARYHSLSLALEDGPAGGIAAPQIALRGPDILGPRH